MSDIIRVLNVTTVLQAAGIESFIMNMYRNIDRERVQFDFMVMRDEIEFYDAEIKALGGKKYTVAVSANNTLVRVVKESIQLYKFLKKNPYNIVHVHYTTPLRAFYLLAAKRAGVRVRIYHSHSAKVTDKSTAKLFFYNVCKKGISAWATHNFACSEAAARWMFDTGVLNSKKYKVIYNGIDVNKFRYDYSLRQRIREELNIENNYVVIHTGRFLEQKNHSFIIKVFKSLKQSCSEAKLLLLGTGELVESIKQKVHDLGLESDVLFLGVCSDVNRYLCGADCFVMPSLYEGLPVAAIEAECAGLPCVFSTEITKEVALTKNVTFLSLGDPVEKWREEILRKRNVERGDAREVIKAHGYDVQDVANNLQIFYEQSVKEEKYSHF